MQPFNSKKILHPFTRQQSHLKQPLDFSDSICYIIKKQRKGRVKMSKKDGAKKFFNEFKEMINKGNVFDMAIGVVIGGAFGKIVTSLVNDIIMPCISVLTGGGGYASWKIILSEAVMNGDEVVKAENAIMIGSFISAIIDFLIIAFCIFLVIKAIGGAKAKFAKKPEPEPVEEKPAEPAPETELDVLKAIREMLAEKKD